MLRQTLARLAIASCIVLSGVELPSASAAESSDTLTPVHSKAGHFTVRLPGTCQQFPDHPTPPGILHCYLLVSRLPSTRSLFTAAKFVWHDADRARAEFQGLATKDEAGFTKISQQAVTQAGLSGYDLKTRSNKGMGYGYTRMLLDGDTIYLLIAESLPGQDKVLQTPIHKFFGSLTIDKREH